MTVLRTLLAKLKAQCTVDALKHDAALFAGFFAASGVLGSGSLTTDALVSAAVVAARRTVVAIAAGK